MLELDGGGGEVLEVVDFGLVLVAVLLSVHDFIEFIHAINIFNNYPII